MENINHIMKDFPSPTSLVVKREAKIADDAATVRANAVSFWQKFAGKMINAAEDGKDSIKGVFDDGVDPIVAKEVLLEMNGKVNGEEQKCQYTIELGARFAFTVYWKAIPQCESNAINQPDTVF